MNNFESGANVEVSIPSFEVSMASPLKAGFGVVETYDSTDNSYLVRITDVRAQFTDDTRSAKEGEKYWVYAQYVFDPLNRPFKLGDRVVDWEGRKGTVSSIDSSRTTYLPYFVDFDNEFSLWCTTGELVKEEEEKFGGVSVTHACVDDLIDIAEEPPVPVKPDANQAFADALRIIIADEVNKAVGELVNQVKDLQQEVERLRSVTNEACDFSEFVDSIVDERTFKNAVESRVEEVTSNNDHLRETIKDELRNIRLDI